MYISNVHIWWQSVKPRTRPRFGAAQPCRTTFTAGVLHQPFFGPSDNFMGWRAARANRAAQEIERSHDGEARFPSRERRAGCPKPTSGELARASPVPSPRPMEIPDEPPFFGPSGNFMGWRACPCQSSGVGNRAEPRWRSEVSSFFFSRHGTRLSVIARSKPIRAGSSCRLYFDEKVVRQLFRLLPPS